MNKLDQFLCIHLGQAGLQMGSKYWELANFEHNISPDGMKLLPNDSFTDSGTSCLYDHGNNNNYIPRSIFIDSEVDVMNEIRTSSYRSLFNDRFMINSLEDAGNNYARGSYVIGRQLIVPMLDAIRRLVESTDNLRSFLVFHSSGGGTGSGLSSLLTLSLFNMYPKIKRGCITVVPSCNFQSSMVEPYNVTLQHFSSVEIADLGVMFDNSTIYEQCCQRLQFEAPSFSQVNRLIGLILSGFALPLCRGDDPGSSGSGVNLAELVTNLVPYPRIHFPVLKYVPLVSLGCGHHHYTGREGGEGGSMAHLSTTQLVRTLFDARTVNRSIRIDLDKGYFMALVLNMFGSVSLRELQAEMAHLKPRFVEWTPTGTKVNVQRQIPACVASGSTSINIAPAEQAALMLVNSTAISQFFRHTRQRFETLFQRRAFVHWYTNETMELSEFEDANEEIEMMVGDYFEIGMTEKQLVNMYLENSKSRAVSHQITCPVDSNPNTSLNSYF